MVFGTYIGNAQSRGLSDVLLDLVSVGDTSGLRFQCPSRCTGVQIKVNNTSGWANIDYFRCIAKYHHSEIHRNPAIHSHPDVSQLISRDSTRFPSQHIPARVNLTMICAEIRLELWLCYNRISSRL